MFPIAWVHLDMFPIALGASGRVSDRHVHLDMFPIALGASGHVSDRQVHLDVFPMCIWVIIALGAAVVPSIPVTDRYEHEVYPLR